MIHGLTNHLWLSTLFAAAEGLLTVAFHKNRAGNPVLALVDRVGQIPGAVFVALTLATHLEWATTAKRIAAPAISSAVTQITNHFRMARA
jgi:hypothetical protein